MKIQAAILIMKDWRERAFLRAQIIEEGIRVLAVETMYDAEEWLRDPKIAPIIIIYDTQFQGNTSQDIKRLSKYISSMPILIITSAACKSTYEIENLGFKHIIRRPISIGDVVGRVKEILLAYQL